jgi:hypothetical protein
MIRFYLSSRGLSNRTIGMIMGFGVGAFLSAIAFKLVPESMVGSGVFVAVSFALGAFPSSASIG